MKSDKDSKPIAVLPVPLVPPVSSPISILLFPSFRTILPTTCNFSEGKVVPIPNPVDVNLPISVPAILNCIPLVTSVACILIGADEAS